MKKRLTVILILVVLMFSNFMVYAQTDRQYNDVFASDWFYDAVKYVSSNDVMIGVADLEFAPETELTRGMAVTILSRIYGADVSGFTHTAFTDVDIDKYYGVHVAWAKQNGIVHGMTETEFCPDDFMTREQVCVILSNFFDFCGLSTRNTPVQSFADEDKIGKWALEAVLRMQRGGIVNGRNDNTFDPKGYITRAEFAQIVYNTNLIKLLKPNEDAGLAQQTDNTAK